MKQFILKALKAKFTGVSEGVLNKVADKISKTVTKEEDVATAVDGVTFQAVMDACLADQKQATIAEYEGQYGLKDGKKVETAAAIDPVPAGGDLECMINRAVTAAVKPFQDEINTLKSGKTLDNRKQLLTTAIGKAPAKFKERYEKDFSRMTFQDDAEYATWLEEVKADVDSFAEEGNTKGAVFGRPVGGSGLVSKEKPSDAELDAVVGNF